MYATPSAARERIPKIPLPFDTIHIDHFGPITAIKSKRKHVLVVIDSFKKFVKSTLQIPQLHGRQWPHYINTLATTVGLEE